MPVRLLTYTFGSELQKCFLGRFSRNPEQHRLMWLMHADCLIPFDVLCGHETCVTTHFRSVSSKEGARGFIVHRSNSVWSTVNLCRTYLRPSRPRTPLSCTRYIHPKIHATSGGWPKMQTAHKIATRHGWSCICGHEARRIPRPVLAAAAKRTAESVTSRHHTALRPIR